MEVILSTSYYRIHEIWFNQRISAKKRIILPRIQFNDEFELIQR